MSIVLDGDTGLTLPVPLTVANGGTGATTQQGSLNALVGTQTANRVLRSDGTNVALAQVALATDVTGTLPVANGGTGAATLTANNVLLGNGTSAVQVVAPGTAGNVLTSNGTTWTSAAPAGGSPKAVTYTFTGPADPIGSIILSAPTPVQIGGTVEPVTGAFATAIAFGDTRATAISFTNLQGLVQSFNPNNLAALTTLSFPSLTSVGTSFNPNNLAALTTLSIPALTSVGTTFNPASMAALTTLSAPALTSVGTTFNPNDNGALTTLSIPALTSVGTNFNPASMAALTTLSIPALTSVGSLFNPNNLAALTTLSAPALTSVGIGFNPATMASLTTISIPAIVSLGGVTLNFNTSALTTFQFPSTLLRVAGGTGNVVISSAALNQTSVDSILVRLAALDGTAGTTTFNNRTVTITGTSSTPSGAGLTAKSTLVARGCTVTNN